MPIKKHGKMVASMWWNTLTSYVIYVYIGKLFHYLCWITQSWVHQLLFLLSCLIQTCLVSIKMMIFLIYAIFWFLLQACHILLNGDGWERNELIDAKGNSSDDFLQNEYLTQTACLLDMECKNGMMHVAPYWLS